MKRSPAAAEPHEDPGLPRAERIALLRYDYAAQEKEELDSCNLCGQHYLTVLTHRDRYGYGAQAVGCNRCGLVFLSPRMTAAAYARFYDGVYRPLVSAYHGRRIDAQSIQPEQASYADEMSRLVAPYLRGAGKGTLLDIGGSTGVVAAQLAERFGLRGTVLDPAPAELEQAAARGLETIAGLIEHWTPGARRFDVVGFFQTIDHVLDPSTTLAKIRSVLADDGLLVVDVVDFRAAYLKNRSVEMAIKIDHPYSLTEETAEAYLARAGFSILRKAYSADHHLVAYVCRKAEPQPVTPAAADVARFFRELRAVQNGALPSS